MKPSGLFGDLESIIQQPKDKGILLKDILEKEVDEKYFLSEKMIATITRHGNNIIDENENPKQSCTIHAGYFKMGGRDQQYVKDFKGLDLNAKSRTIRSGGSATATDKHNWDLIVHNTMPRSSTTGKGGTGHLSRTDGKTYCLDTGNTNAVELPAIYDDYNGNIRKDGKTCTLTVNSGSKAARNWQKVILDTNAVEVRENKLRIRRLTPTECERLQTVKDGYTNHVSDSQRYKMLGNGWTVDVIVHFFNYLKLEI
jgi:DNA (cytosine-5)-methyltransferase 3A